MHDNQAMTAMTSAKEAMRLALGSHKNLITTVIAIEGALFFALQSIAYTLDAILAETEAMRADADMASKRRALQAELREETHGTNIR